MIDVIKAAKESGLDIYGLGTDAVKFIHALERFEKIVRVDERELCAKVCENKIDAEYATGKVDHNEMAWTQACAFAIRLRERS